MAGDSANVFTNTMVPNDSDGLYKYLTKSYPECPQLNPFVLDWGSNPACDYTSPTGMALGSRLSSFPARRTTTGAGCPAFAQCSTPPESSRQ